MNEEHFWNPLTEKLSDKTSTKEKAEPESPLKTYPNFKPPIQQPVPLWVSNKTDCRFLIKETFQGYEHKRWDNCGQEAMTQEPALLFFFLRPLGISALSKQHRSLQTALRKSKRHIPTYRLYKPGAA